MFKKCLVAAICFCIFISNANLIVFASEESDNNAQEITLGEKGGYLAGNFSSTKDLNNQIRFTWGNAGKGFAAEQANNLSNVLHGKKAKIVGGNNIRNGPDRMIINRDGSKALIQTKYHSNASKSVSDAFDNETGFYKYVDKDGNPMQLEVPKDQGSKAIGDMEKRIREGKVRNVKDPAEAKNIIREGSYTFDQAKNIAKAGNIDSLKYDAKNGVINATGAMGISFTLDFASCMINGDDWQTALKNASINSLKTGSGVAVVYIISSQLGKAGVASIFKPAGDKVASILGDKTIKSLTDLFGYKGQIPSQNAVSGILQSQLLFTTVTIVAFSVPDVIDLFDGRISSKQLAINLAVLVGGTAGASVCGLLGSSAGPIGGIAGGIVGGTLGSYASDTLLTTVFETDSEEMTKIIENEFSKVSQKYLVSEKEVNNITKTLQNELSTKKLKDMYESEDRKKYANSMIMTIFENEINQRKKISVPTQEQVRNQLISNMDDVVYIH